VLTAFVGYILALMGLLGDLGLPWRIYHPLYMGNPPSFMFEVAWCLMLYTTVLFVEFLPMPLERLGLGRLLRMVRKVMPVFIVLGIVLSTLHQSSLGSLFLLMGHRLHPLWWSPILPVNFLLTAICVGFAMVVFDPRLSYNSLGNVARLPPRPKPLAQESPGQRVLGRRPAFADIVELLDRHDPPGRRPQLLGRHVPAGHPPQQVGRLREQVGEHAAQELAQD
jgi:hypothetical protein